MTSVIIRLFVLSVSIFLIAKIVPGIRLRGFKSAIWVAGVYGLLNFALFKVLWFITFPLILLKYLTLGLFGIVLNAILLMIADKFLDDFELAGFGTALLAALGISLVNIALSLVLGLSYF